MHKFTTLVINITRLVSGSWLLQGHTVGNAYIMHCAGNFSVNVSNIWKNSPVEGVLVINYYIYYRVVKYTLCDIKSMFVFGPLPRSFA
jgi:hypothetical protein